MERWKDRSDGMKRKKSGSYWMTLRKREDNGN
jgi:hypothetical protein